MIQFDIILEDIGEIGLAQIILFGFIAYFNICGGVNALASVFIAYEPPVR